MASLPDHVTSCSDFLVSCPQQGSLLVVINRPAALNSLTTSASEELDRILQWFDSEPSLCVAIITGKGRAFCVGADLKEWVANNKKGLRMKLPDNGFGGISLRIGKKPIIAAVNGPAFGGGLEMVVNCDLVVASTKATFALPETKRGVTPFAGALPRLMSIIGRQRATELALTGRILLATDAKEWGLCNSLTDGASETVVSKALELAKEIAATSLDAMIATRQGLHGGWDGLSMEEASRTFLKGWANRIYEGPNVQEGLDAFQEKRSPRWEHSKL